MKEIVDSVTKFTVAWPLVSNISVDLTPTLFLEMFNLCRTIILLRQSKKTITSNIEDIFFYIFPDLSLIASSRFSI